jgi:hypothetical protein
LLGLLVADHWQAVRPYAKRHNARYAHLDNDPLKEASEHIGNRLAAAMGEVKAPRANVTSISKAKRSKNQQP